MPTALAASSMLRCVSKAATAASILLPNLVPCPFIFPILSQTDTTSRTRPPLHLQPFAIPRFPQNCLASCSNQSDGCHRRGNHRQRRKKMTTSTTNEQALQPTPASDGQEPKADTKPSPAPRKPRVAAAKGKASKA